MPIILYEDEYKKLGKHTLIMPQHLVDTITKNGKVYLNDKNYANSKGAKRLKGLLYQDYNDPKNNDSKQHNNKTVLTFAAAKRLESDFNHMVQSPDNIEYAMLGGDEMRDWVHNSLRALRNSVHKVSSVPEVPKLSQNDIKPKNTTNVIKVSGVDVKVESKGDFNKKIKQMFG